MKNLLIMICTACAGIGIIACDRSALPVDAPLGVSKTSAIKKGEPVDFSFNSYANTDQIIWRVTPDKNARINAMGKNARISFSEAGNYTVTASDPEISAHTVIKVDTSVYVPQDTVSRADTLSTSIPQDTITSIPPKPELPIPADTIKTAAVDTVGTHNIFNSLVGDHFTLTPSIVDTLSVAGLAVRIESTKSYNCLNSYLTFNHFFKNPATNVFRLGLYNVTQPGARYCQSGEQPVSANTLLYPINEGENKIEVVLNGHLYSGTVTRRDKSFTIDWPDASEVSFSKLVLNK